MRERTIGGIVVKLVVGDIADQPEVVAVVNAANAALKPGGGVAGAIHEAAGPELEEACRPYAPIEPGEAVITMAYKLPNEYVIHCLGPVYGRDEPSDELLASCYRAALKLCETHDVESVAFPAISTGIFGYPIREAAEVALKAVLDGLPYLEMIREIRFVLFHEKDLEIFEEAFDRLEA
jgi:O-acetyl-ADP-ribose deacetylase (regulator of RNase III)